jgi:hypothetical protein
MDIAGFLRNCLAEWEGFDEHDRLAGTVHPRNRRLADLPAEIEGYATENKLMLLNLAARHLEPGEVYVEVGCWRGLSLAGAAHGNLDVPIYACDDFSRMGASRDRLHEALKRHTEPGHIRFFDQDFREFMAAAPWRPARVGAYFYDGGHSFRDQFSALELIRPHLADEALIIVDDTNDLPVRRANQLFIRYNPDFELLREIRVKEYQDQAWWNGIQLIRYRAAAAPSTRDARRVPLARYIAEWLLWNRALFYGQRATRLVVHGRRAVRNGLTRMVQGRRPQRTEA